LVIDAKKGKNRDNPMKKYYKIDYFGKKLIIKPFQPVSMPKNPNIF